jgi:NAD(P)-dependent dehydrogenase (short-subunit alcohol dehydrogenase family)
MHKLLEGKRAVITGASRGLGPVIAEAMWEQGATLLLVARSTEPLNQLRLRLEENAGLDQSVSTFAADLADEASPKKIFDEARSLWPSIDVLVNNAGIIGPMGMVADNDWPSWREALQVNLLAPAELCHLSIKWMRETITEGSIINLSGGGAASPRPNFSAYGTSKAGLVRFSETVASEVKSLGIRVNCIAPGPMNTEMLQETLRAGPEAVGSDEHRKIVKFVNGGAADPRTAADLAVYLASSNSGGITGRLVSAVWDPWKRLADYAQDIQGSDIYTLRRILPEERGKAWAND